MATSTPTSTPARPRTHFTDKDRLDFVQQIVANQRDCPPRGRTQFWADQAAIFARTHGGKLIKNGSKFVGDMTGPHIAQRKVERTESGTVQPDTELGQALDRWVQFEDGQKAESLAAVEERRREGEAMRGRRGQMLQPNHLRRVASAATLDTPRSSGPVSSAPGPHPLRRAA
jgi:hypothetical protein